MKGSKGKSYPEVRSDLSEEETTSTRLEELIAVSEGEKSAVKSVVGKSMLRHLETGDMEYAHWG